jgi:hypothetical protein
VYRGVDIRFYPFLYVAECISDNVMWLLMRAAGAYPAGPPPEAMPDLNPGGQGGASVCTADAATTS